MNQILSQELCDFLSAFLAQSLLFQEFLQVRARKEQEALAYNLQKDLIRHCSLVRRNFKIMKLLCNNP